MGGFPVTNLFDDSTSSVFTIENPLAEEWAQVQLSSGKTCRSFSWRCSGVASNSVDQIILKGSNTGAFGGEETSIYDTGSGLSWSASETKTWSFSNSTSYTYYRFYLYRKNTSYLNATEVAMYE
jgi:hypothetical protein